MTPTELLDELKVFCETETANLLLRVKTKPSASAEIEYKRPAVYKQRIPVLEDQAKKVPYILLQVLNGADVQQNGQETSSSCNVRIIVCSYSLDSEEGAANTLNIITRLRTALLKKRVIGQYFSLVLPLEYILYPDDTAPYFMGELASSWTMPTIEREVQLI